MMLLISHKTDLLNYIWTIWTKPSLNDVTFNVDAGINIPSIHVYRKGFGQAGVAGTVYGTFSIPQERLRQFISILKEIKLDLRPWLQSPDY